MWNICGDNYEIMALSGIYSEHVEGAKHMRNICGSHRKTFIGTESTIHGILSMPPRSLDDILNQRVL